MHVYAHNTICMHELENVWANKRVELGSLEHVFNFIKRDLSRINPYMFRP